MTGQNPTQSITQQTAQAGAQTQGFFFDLNIANTLTGRTLSTGWKVIEKLSEDKSVPSKYHTGGFFSVCYRAERVRNGETEEGFLKVYDLASAMLLNQNDLMKSLSHITNSHQFECSMLEICKSSNMDRIVRIIDRGDDQIATSQGFPMPISYIVFEKADGDVRKAMRRTAAVEHAWIFEILHNVAVGIGQLHQKKITHQDIKPSNVLTFEKSNEGAKLGDLGRAVAHGHAGAGHEVDPIAGDKGYAPPEQAYGHRAVEWVDRRESCDLYHLGCLMCFLFAGVTPNQFYKKDMDKSVLPIIWNGAAYGNYDEALPHLSASFAELLNDIGGAFPSWCKDDCIELVRRMCNPDYRLRGDPKTRAMHGKLLGIDRFVTKFDLLRAGAKVNARKAP